MTDGVREVGVAHVGESVSYILLYDPKVFTISLEPLISVI